MQSMAMANGVGSSSVAHARRSPSPSGGQPARTPQDALRALQPIGVVAAYERGEGIYREGDGATHWYEVASGALRTCKLLADGRRQIGDFLLPGDVFGFEVGDAHTIDVEAIVPASVTRFSRARVRLIAETQAGLATRLQQLAFETVSKAHARLLVLARQTAQERVAGFLLEMRARLAPEGGPFTLPMARQDIADYLCLTIETVCRVIADLKRESTIAMPSPQHLGRIDEAVLRRIVGA